MQQFYRKINVMINFAVLIDIGGVIMSYYVNLTVEGDIDDFIFQEEEWYESER